MRLVSGYVIPFVLINILSELGLRFTKLFLESPHGRSSWQKSIHSSSDQDKTRERRVGRVSVADIRGEGSSSYYSLLVNI